MNRALSDVRLRAGKHPALLFDRLHALGLVVLYDSADAAQEAIARDARNGDAITVATNDEVRELNTRIRNERVRAGLVDDHSTTTGSDGLSIGRGDVIQTRRNDSDTQVANRQTWSVQAVGADGTVWSKENTTDRKRQRTVRLPAEYVAEHTHLAYASTVYGVYVGMTRGREANRLHVVAGNLDDARGQFVLALERDRADRGLTRATAVAREAVIGLAVDGPVRLVNATKARVRQQIQATEHLVRASTGAQTALY